uniref:Uncharacterized protein n=1 Tax=Echinococcus granulosus TaxID=6210 RepID=A0A068WPK1_ECHGR|nr:hypothetical protein EgrG_000097700 [Echinococcus granulosus]
MLRCAISYPTIQCECNPPTSSPIRKYLQDYRCRAIRKNPVYPKCANYHPSAWSPNSQVLLSNMNSMKDHYFDRVHFGSNHPDNKRCNELKQFEDVRLNLSGRFAFIIVDRKKSRILQGYGWNPLPTRVLLPIYPTSTKDSAEILFLIIFILYSFYTNRHQFVY